MASKPKEAFHRGLEIWSALSASDQSAARVLSELKREGFRVSQASVFRWVKEWKGVVHAAVEMLEAEPASASDDRASSSRELAAPIDVPADLRDILPARLLPVAKGRGADALEAAVCTISEAVRARAEEIVESDDKNRMRTFVSALNVMSGVIERIAAARSTASIAHRSYCEGDRLLAEGERLRAEAQKFSAEAEVAMCGVRALNAKEIPVIANDVSEAKGQEALAILRGQCPQISGGSK